MIQRFPAHTFVVTAVFLYCSCGLNMLANPSYADGLSSIDQAYIAFEESRYKDCIRLAGQSLVSSSDQEDLGHAGELLLLGTQLEYGCDAALEKANQLRGSHPPGLSWMSVVEKTASDIELYRAQYRSAAMEGRQIIEKHPGTEQAALAQLNIARQASFLDCWRSAAQAYLQVIDAYCCEAVTSMAMNDLECLCKLRGDDQEARDILLKAARTIENDKLTEMVTVRLGSLYVQSGAYSEGAKRMNDLLKAPRRDGGPSMKSAILFYAGLLSELQGGKKIDDALVCYGDSIKAAPNCSHATESVGRMSRLYETVRGGREEAIRRMEKLSESYPKTRTAACALFFVARANAKLDKTSEAKKAYLAALSHNDTGVDAKDAQHELAYLYLKQADECNKKGDTDGATKALEAVVRYRFIDERERTRLGQYDVEILFRLAEKYRYQCRYGEALACLELVEHAVHISRMEFAKDTPLRKAEIYMQMDDYDSASKVLRKITDSSVASTGLTYVQAKAYHRMAEIYCRSQDYVKAIKLLTKVVNLAPDDMTKEPSRRLLVGIRRKVGVD